MAAAQRRLNGWQRLGCVVSACWALFAGGVVVDGYMDATNGRWSPFFAKAAPWEAGDRVVGGRRDARDAFLDAPMNRKGPAGDWEVVDRRPLELEQAKPSGGALDDLIPGDRSPAKSPATPAPPVTWGLKDRPANSFDDLPDSKRAAEHGNVFDQFDSSTVVPVWGQIVALVFAPIAVLWVLAYVGVFAVRWVIAGFRGS